MAIRLATHLKSDKCHLTQPAEPLTLRTAAGGFVPAKMDPIAVRGPID